MKKINHIQRSSIAKHLLISALVAPALLAVAISSANATTELGQPYRPTGANFQIYAEQNVSLTTGQGQSGTPQVNLGFEANNGIGVQYDDSGGKSHDFGIGIFSSSGGPDNTGLKVLYDNQNTLASGLTVRLEDFDLMQN